MEYEFIWIYGSGLHAFVLANGHRIDWQFVLFQFAFQAFLFLSCIRRISIISQRTHAYDLLQSALIERHKNSAMTILNRSGTLSFLGGSLVIDGHYHCRLASFIGDGGTERWVAYPIMLWLIGFGGYLMNVERTSPKRTDGQPGN